MHIVVASSSIYRQSLYHDAILELGHCTAAASGGVECIRALRDTAASLLVIEAPLLWGGCEGVLDVIGQEYGAELGVILIAAGNIGVDWFALSRFRVDDFFSRVPTGPELQTAIARIAERERDKAALQEAARERARLQSEASPPAASTPAAWPKGPYFLDCSPLNAVPPSAH